VKEMVRIEWLSNRVRSLSSSLSGIGCAGVGVEIVL